MPSKDTDTKVVEMQFDNQQFEDGVKQTIKSLDDLKKSLNFDEATKSLDSINQNVNKIDFSTLNAALEATQRRFSIWGQMGEAAVNRVVNTVLAKAERLTRSLTVDQLSAGWQKYESVLTSTRTMMSATGATADEVGDSLKKLMTFADETSYSYADMADSMGKFAAKGFGGKSGAEAVEVARQVAEGIAVWAAQAGQNAQTAARATYQMSQISGWMKLQDWRSIINANMATKQFMELSMAVAQANGTLKKIGDTFVTTGKAAKEGVEVGIQNFQDTLTDSGWLTTDVFTQTMQEYNSFFDATQKVIDAGLAKNTTEAMAKIKAGGKEITDLVGDWGDKYHQTLEKAFEAGQISKTFSDSIDATKDAVSSAFTDIFNVIFGNVDQAAELFTDVTDVLYDTVVQPFKDAQEAFAEFNSDTEHNFVQVGEEGEAKLNRITGGIYQMMEGIRNVVLMVEDAFSKLVPPITVERINNLSQSFYNLMTRFKNNTTFKGFKDSINEVADGALHGSNTVKKATQVVSNATEDLSEVITRVIRGDFANAQDRFQALANAGYNWAKVQNGVNERLNNSWRYSEETIAEAQKMISGYTESLNNVTESTEEITSSTNKVTPAIQSMTMAAVKALGTGDKIHIILGGIADAIGIVVDAGKAVIDTVIKPILSYTVPKVMNVVLNGLTYIADKISVLRANLQNSGVITKVLNKFMDGVRYVKDFVEDLFSTIKNNDAFKTFVGNLQTFGQNVKSTFGTMFGTIGDFFKGFGDGLNSVFTNIGINRGGVMNTIITAIFNTINKVIDVLKPVGNVIKQFFEGVRESVKGIDWTSIITNLGKFAGAVGKLVGSGIEKVTQLVKDFFATFEATHSGKNPLQVAAANIQRFFNNLPFKSIGTILGKFNPTKAIGGFVSALTPSKFKGYISIIKDFGASMLGVEKGSRGLATGVGGVKKALAPFTGFMNNSFKPVVNFLKPVGDTLSKVGEDFKMFFSNINWATVVDVAKVGAVLILASKIGKTIDSFKNIADSFSGIGKSISGFFDQLAHNSRKRTNAKAFKDIAIGIGILAGSLFLLCQVDSDKLTNASIAIGILAGELGALSFIMTKFGGSSWSNLASGGSVLMFASAIVMLAGELEPLSKMDNWDYANGAAKIAGIGSILIALTDINELIQTKLLKGPGSFTKGQALKVLASAAALWMFADSIKKVVEALVDIASNQTLLENSDATLKLLIGIVGTLSLLSYAASGVKFSSGLGVLALVYAIKSWLETLDFIAKFDTTAIQKNLPKIVAVVGTMVLLIGAVSLLTKGNSKGMIGAAAVILSIGVTVNLIALAIKKLAKVSDNDVGKATIAIDSIILFLGIAGAMISSSNSFLMGNGERSMKDMAKTFVGMGLAVLIISFAIKNIASIDRGQMIAATGCVDSIIIFLGLSTKMMSGSKSATAAWISLSLTMIAMAVVVKMLSDLITNYGLLTAIFATGMVDSMLVSLGYVFKQAGTIHSAAAAVSIGLMIGVILAIAYLVNEIAKIPDPIGAAATLGAVDGMLLAFAGVTLAAQKVGQTGLKGLGAALLGGVEILGVIGELAFGVAGLAEAMQAVITHFGGSWDDATKTIDNFFTLLEHIGTGVGKFFGGLIGGAITGAVSNMDLSNLSTLVQQTSDFLDSIQGFDAKKLSKLDDFAKSASSISSALDSLKELAGKVLSKDETDTLSTNLDEFGQALFDFGQNVEGLDQYQAAFRAAKTAASSLQSLSEVIKPGLGDVLMTALTGESTWTTVGQGLSEFGDGMESFAESMQPFVDDPTLQSALDYGATQAGPELAELEGNLPTVGGLKGKLFGDVSWATIGTGLAEFGQAMQDFGGNVTGLKDYDADLTYACETLGPKLIAFKSSIPGKDEGGLIGWFKRNFVGGTDNGWSTIGTDLADFGTAMNQFAQNLSGISSYAKDIDNADLVLQKITSLVRALGSKDFNITDLSGTINNLPKLGDYLLQFAQKVTPEGGFPLTADSSIFKVMDKLTGYTGDYSSLQTFADGIKNLSKSIKSLNTAAIRYNSEAIGNVFGDLDKLKTYASDFIANGNLEQFSSLGEQILSTLATGLSDKDDSVKSAVTTLLSNAANNSSTDSDILNMYKALGEKLMGDSGVAGGVSDDSSVSSVKNAISTAVDTAVNELDFSSKLTSAGNDLINGLVAGINGAIWKVRSAMANVAAQTNKTFTMKTEVSSPSRLYMRYGNWLMEGLAIGIKRGVGKATEASENAAYSVSGSMYDNLHTPSISPVYTPYNSMAFANGINSDWGSTSYAMAAGIDAAERATRLAQISTPVNNQNGNVNSNNSGNEEYTINIPLALNGRQIAKATARFSRDELNRMDRFDARKKGEY